MKDGAGGRGYEMNELRCGRPKKMDLVGEGAGLGSERLNGGKETVDGGQ